MLFKGCATPYATLFSRAGGVEREAAVTVQDALRYRMQRLVSPACAETCRARCGALTCRQLHGLLLLGSPACRQRVQIDLGRIPFVAAAGHRRGVGRPPAAEAQDREPHGKLCCAVPCHALLCCAALSCAVICLQSTPHLGMQQLRLP